MATIQPSKHLLKGGEEIVLRHAVEADARGLLDTVGTYIAENEGQVWEPGEFNQTEDQEREWIRETLQHPKEILILAESGGQIIGNIDFHIGTRRRTAHIGHFGMGILPTWRSKGVGSVLLGRMIDWATQAPDIEKIGLRVIATNSRGIALYKKFGFIEEGRGSREFKYADGSYQDDVSMGLQIKSALAKR